MSKENSTELITENIFEDLIINEAEKILEYQMLRLDKIRPSRKNLFPELDIDRHEEFKTTINPINGVNEAIIVRPIADIDDYEADHEFLEAEYEILSGHKRFRAVTDLGLLYIKAEIRRGLTEDESMELMIGCNVDRQSFSELPYSVQAKILKERQRILLSKKRSEKSLETNDKMGDNSDGCQNDNGKRINEHLEEEYDIDDRKVARLLRMADHLNEELFEKVDKEVIPFMAAHDLSFLTLTEQKWINDVTNALIKENGSFKVNGKMAETLKTKHGKLSKEKVTKVLHGHNGTPKKAFSVTLGAKIQKAFFDENTSTDLIRDKIEEALTYRSDVTDKINEHLLSVEPSEFDIENFIRFFKKDFRMPSFKKSCEGNDKEFFITPMFKKDQS